MTNTFLYEGRLSGIPISGDERIQIKIEGKLKHIGLFKTVEEASAAYQAAKDLHGEFYATLFETGVSFGNLSNTEILSAMMSTIDCGTP